jgi:ABC-type transport system substrate-binding protein
MAGGLPVATEGIGGPETILRIPMRSDGPKSFDPVRGSTTYDHTASCQVYETLLQYKYLARPFALEPLLLSEMPRTEDGLNYEFHLKPSVHFHDNLCFPGGRGRELTSADVFYSWKRMADEDNLPKSWWLFEETIAGFDEYRREQNAAGRFDYDAPVEGLQIVDRYRFRVRLKQPVQRFLWVLAMFQTAIVPREAVESHGRRFGRHPVGTGPFMLREEDWTAGQRIVFRRNPNYHGWFEPRQHAVDAGAGTNESRRRLPLVDRLEIRMFVQDQPMWLQFLVGRLDCTEVPAEYFREAFIKRTGRLRGRFEREGITSHAVPLLDFIFRGFNMEDPLLGGLEPRKKHLRQAICLALNWEEQNDAFYNGLNIIYDGPIPPGLEGHPPGGRAPVSYRGPDPERARRLLKLAGYPDGRGLPAIDFYTSRGANNAEQAEMLARQLSRIGIRINKRLVDFSTLIEAINNKKAPFFSFAWGSDYPDAENNLALFYSPNVSPGSNHFNYRRDEYDRFYEAIRTMPPSDERTKIYETMRDMLIEDAPFAGSMARTRYYLVWPRLKNFLPTESFHNWFKYLEVGPTETLSAGL